MSNVTRLVWEILSNDISIRKDLARGIINNRALAKFIIKKHNLSTSVDGVISAIRRFEKDKGVQENFRTIKESLKGAKVSTKTNLVCVTIAENSQNIQHLSQVIKDHREFKDINWRIIKGEEVMKIILSQQDLPTFKKYVRKEAILSALPELSEINIQLSDKACATKGLFARLCNEIANHDVNIEEAITVLPELLIFVRNADLIKAHNAGISLVSGGLDV